MGNKKKKGLSKTATYVSKLSKKKRLALVKKRLSVKEAQDFNEKLCNLIKKYTKKLDVTLMLGILEQTKLAFHRSTFDKTLRGELILPPKIK